MIESMPAINMRALGLASPLFQPRLAHTASLPRHIGLNYFRPLPDYVLSPAYWGA